MTNYDSFDLYVLWYLFGAVVIYLGYQADTNIMLIISGILCKLYAIMNLCFILFKKEKKND